MKRKIHCLCFILACLATQPACSGYPSKYSAERIEARIVDADTKQPLAGVIVTANWQLESGNPGGSFYAGQMMVMEAITDKDGKFAFPAWGPLPRKQGFLLNRDPQLLLFKPGYKYAALYNEFRDKMYLEPVRRSEWSGRTIELKLFKGTMEEYARHLSSLHTSVRSILNAGECEWTRMPRLMVAIDKQEKFFRDQGIYSPLYAIDDLPSGKCGSPKELLREFMQ